METVSEDLLRKIKQIQELAQRGGTVHEAEAAAGKLTELLLKHNLTLLDLDQVSDERGIKVSEQLFWLSAVSNWRRELLNQVARANGCRVLIWGGTKGCNIIGYPHNIITTINFYQWIESVLDDIVREEKDRLKHRIDWPDDQYIDFDDYFNGTSEFDRLEASRRLLIANSQQWGRSFRYGFVAGLADKMKQARRKVEVEVGDKWALVPIMEQEVDDYLNAQKDVKVHRHRPNISQSAQRHGYRRGQQVNVDPQLATGYAHTAIGG